MPWSIFLDMCVQASVLLSHVLAPPDVLLQFVRVLIGQLLHVLPQGFAPLDIPPHLVRVLRGQLIHLLGQLLDLIEGSSCRWPAR